MKKKHDIILSAEEAFARKVVLGVIVTRPVTVGHYLIPGMFIFDFLRRIKEIKRYSQYFLFPRKLAINAAQDFTHGEDKENILFRLKEDIKGWLDSLNLYSMELHRKQMEVINLLIDHYSKLLHGEGNSYHLLIKNAYRDRKNYEAFLCQLASVEEEVDKAITGTLGETENLRERLLAEQTQVEKQRGKNIDEIFAA